MDSGTVDLRRVAVGLLVVAAHVWLILVVKPGTRQTAEVLEVTLLPSPITTSPTESEDHPRVPKRAPEPALAAPKLPPPNVSIRAARTRAQPPAVAPVPQPSEAQNESDAVTESPKQPPARIDWYAEAQTTAEALEQRDRIERQRHSFTAPTQGSLSPRRVKPECPFERCEPGWGAGFSVFPSSKKGRIENTPDKEVIRWTSNHCYVILVSPDVIHRGMNKCEIPLGKRSARGDLFKHMKEVPPPEEHATDVP